MSGKGSEEFEQILAGIAAKHAHLYVPRMAEFPLREFRLAPDPIFCPAQTYRQTRRPRTRH